jgi:hypothetical protein
VKCTDVCPHKPHLLLAGSDDLFAIAQGDLQRESLGDRREGRGDPVPGLLLRTDGYWFEAVGCNKLGPDQRPPVHGLPTFHIEDQDLVLLVEVGLQLADECERRVIEIIGTHLNQRVLLDPESLPKR